MNLIQVLLIVSVIAVVWGFRNRYRVGLRAGARLLGLLLCVLAILSIVQPGIAQEAAELVGVTRGTDLVLYLLVIVFAATSMGFYFHFRDIERRFASLARVIALNEAVTSQGLPDGHARTDSAEA
ncbi:DUF2304 domain-containing protein [Jatrophihabitans telluris]|uniref:DUF2304 domain-containing protein n=1 Tax=Jatrophihabitans telluris TaxID=2038343 RepID=A0ABY4QYG9_9ACTN|nr:DUF2304 domain-containing protein [Jatrophihabitans telluris]UQX88683.1 DUF2304 domain-containing protein [Jatrophihabitans telluris]